MKIEIPDSLYRKIYTDWFDEAKKLYQWWFLTRMGYNIGSFFFWFTAWCMCILLLKTVLSALYN